MTQRYERHGMTRTRTLNIWQGMISRCYNQNNPAYPEWGGRGITVCQRWRDSFLAFYDDMGEPPPGLTLDRYPDNNGNYEPENCRWGTRKQQARNTRRNRKFTLNGVTKSAAEWAEDLGISASTIYSRHRLKMPVEKILSSNKHPERASGEHNGKAVLTSNVVIEIFRSKERLVTIAKRFGISSSHVRQIKNGQIWRSVTSKIGVP